MGIESALTSLPKRSIILFVLLQVLVIGVADWFTGAELSLSFYYVFPVVYATWYGGLSAGVAGCFLGSAAWLAADLASGHPYEYPFVPYWNSVVGFGFLFIASRLAHLSKKKLEMEQALASTDPLTGISNIRVFMERLAGEIERAKRYGRSFAVAYIDVDNFKRVNDSLGHEAGNRVLREVACSLSQTTRRSDVVARMGGDEFAGLFPETGYGEAEALSAKLRDVLRGAASQNGWPVTFSIGLVFFEKAPETAEQAVKTADDLMYQVKNNGKDNLAFKQWAL